MTGLVAPHLVEPDAADDFGVAFGGNDAAVENGFVQIREAQFHVRLQPLADVARAGGDSAFRFQVFQGDRVRQSVARTRDVAIARMKRALEMMVIEGIKTTIPLHIKIMNDENFQKGNFSTKFMEDFLK